MLPAAVTPYLLGLVTAPIMAKVVKPLVRGTVKTTVGIALQVKKLATEAVEDVQDLAAEASAEMVSAQMAADAAAKTGLPPAAAAVVGETAAHPTRVSAGTTRRGGTS